jgi:Yip1-like protein
MGTPPGTPWERRAELGFWTGWAQTVQQGLLEPGKLFESVRLDKGASQLGFAVFTTSLFWTIGQVVEGLLLRGQREQLRRMLGTLSRNPDVAPMLQRMLEAQMQTSSAGWVIALALLTPAFTLVFLYVNAAVTHGVAALMGKARRGFPATFAACAYACAPLVLLAVPACGSFVGVIWVIVLTSIGMKVTHHISTGAAAASVLAPYFVLCCLMFLVMGSLMMALRSAAGLP